MTHAHATRLQHTFVHDGLVDILIRVQLMRQSLVNQGTGDATRVEQDLQHLERLARSLIAAHRMDFRDPHQSGNAPES